MDKTEALNEFLKGIRIALSNSFAYPKTHPYFLKSIEVFREKTAPLFIVLNPIKIEVKSDSLSVDGIAFEKMSLYAELAQQLHQRKIKSIQISKDASVEELIDFFSAISLPAKQILRKGGIAEFLKSVSSGHICVEELDYSELLQGQGEEVKDVWVYLFKKCADDNNFQKAFEFADNFERIISNFKAEDLVSDAEFRKNLGVYLDFIRDKERARFTKCTKELLKMVLHSRSAFRHEDLQGLKLFFKDIKAEEAADFLWEELSSDADFNSISLNIFSQLFGEGQHKGISAILEAKAKSAQVLKSSPLLRKKIKEIFSSTQEESSATFYKYALQSLADAEGENDLLVFDRGLLSSNYRLVLLNLFAVEQSSDKLILIIERLIKELDSIVKNQDFEYLNNLLQALNQKQKNAEVSTEALEGLRKKICEAIENAAFEGLLEGRPEFTGFVNSSILGIDIYLGRIFEEGKVNSSVLRLLLALFPDKLDLIFEALNNKRQDIDFIVKFLSSLSQSKEASATEVIRHIFKSSNNIVKIEALKIIKELPEHEQEFLFSELDNLDAKLKKEIIPLLLGEAGNRNRVLEKLFSGYKFWGSKNSVLIENISAIEELGLKEAEVYLLRFSRLPFFWNSALRVKAREALRKL